MRKAYILAIIMVILSLIGAVVSCTPGAPAPTNTSPATTSPTPTSTTPRLLTWGTLDVGAGGYIASGIVSETVKNKFGVDVRLIPMSNSVNRLTVVRIGTVQAGMLSGEARLAREGTGDFASRAWGPQKLRMLYQITGSNGFGTRANSNIYTLSDLKGKNVPSVVGLASLDLSIEAGLNFVGLTVADVKKVEIAGYNAAADALIEGKTDLFLMGIDSALAVKIAASPGGLRWIPLPVADKEGWKAYRKLRPDHVPATFYSGGPEISQDHPLETAATPEILDAYDSLDDDIAYFTTKAWAEGFADYGGKQTRLSKCDVDTVLQNGLNLPFAFHRGSIRYFKEIGKWTPELEAWNSKILAREDALLAAWEACLTEMDAKQLKETELSKLWEQYRSQVPEIQ